MTNSEEKVPIFMHNNSSVPSKHQDYVDEEEAWNKGCDFFGLLFCRRRLRNDAHDTDSLLHHRGGEQVSETWWKSKLKNLKQVSEKLAGPRWKNFVRKMSGYCNKRNKNRFQYDPHSYALNFDNGGADKELGDSLLQDFSYRFAAPFADDQRQRTGSS